VTTNDVDSPSDATTVHHQNSVKQGDVTTSTIERTETQTSLPNNYHVSSSTSEAPSKKHTSLTTLATTWWSEIVWLVLAIAALVAIAVTMAAYHMKEQPAWKYTINLSTLVAILSALLRVCTMAVVEEGNNIHNTLL
jgi:heme/copper-type cytochrome/quinol oxidase subunit 2